jgi:hypothetical protein
MKSLFPRALRVLDLFTLKAASARDPGDLTGEDPFPYDTL